MMPLQGSKPVNPYSAGNPVRTPAFFGREQILQQVEEALASPHQNAIVLCGQRRIGKTSILYELQSRLPAYRFAAVYQDLQDKAREPMSVVLAEIARRTAAALKLSRPDARAFDSDGEYFQDEFLPLVYSELEKTGNRRLVLLLDELDVLDVVQREKLGPDATGNRFFEYLRKLMREELRIGFVFVVGRDVRELDISFLATFKASKTLRVSTLDQETTRKLVKAPMQWEEPVIQYTEDAVEGIWRLAHGQPMLTQALCATVYDRVWERVLGKFSPEPQVDLGDVNLAATDVLAAYKHIFDWIWDGLPPAERIILSALAERLPDDESFISRDEVLETLQRSNVRIITRELTQSPEKLAEWELLERDEQGHYRFFVPLLRRWIRDKKRLAQVREEIDKINPAAQAFFNAGKLAYEAAQPNFESAITNLRQAIQINPEHLEARLVLGQVLLETGDYDGMVSVYEEAHQRDPAQARYGLTNALVLRAELFTQRKEYERAEKDYERILTIHSAESTSATQAKEALAKIHPMALNDRVLRLSKQTQLHELALDWENAVATLTELSNRTCLPCIG
jgi:tetratricopeptide (TPR) repeat protein